MDVDDFEGLTKDHRTKAIAKRDNVDRKRTARHQIALENKQKKEVECLEKLEEREKEKQKEEEKAKAKGKKIDDGNVVVPISSTTDQSSQLVKGS